MEWTARKGGLVPSFSHASLSCETVGSAILMLILLKNAGNVIDYLGR